MLRIRDALWVPADRNVGDFVTIGRRGIWHTTEGSSIAGAESAYRSHGGWPHATWDPRSGEIHQHIDADESAASVMNQAGGVETNRYGALQIEVVAQAAHPFTDLDELEGLDRIMEWLRANGVPDRWPAGAPLAYPESYGFNNPQRDAQLWVSTPGHYGHSQVPENDHGDPGAIDIDKIIGGDDDMPLTAADHDFIAIDAARGTAAAFGARSVKQLRRWFAALREDAGIAAQDDPDDIPETDEELLALLKGDAE